MARGNETETGIVFRTHETEFRGRSLYSFCFDGASDVWYRMGEEDYEGIIEEGYEIEVEFYEDKNGNLVVEDAEVIAEGEPVKSNKRSGGGRGGSRGNSRGGSRSSKRSSGGSKRGGSKQASSSGGAKKDVDWDEKDRKIQYQAARRDAITHVANLVVSESVELPAKTKKSERKVAIDGLVDYYTALFYEDVAGKGAVQRAADERDAPTEVRTKSKKATRSKRPPKQEEPDEEDDGYDDEDDDYEDED